MEFTFKYPSPDPALYEGLLRSYFNLCKNRERAKQLTTVFGYDGVVVDQQADSLLVYTGGARDAVKAALYADSAELDWLDPEHQPIAALLELRAAGQDYAIFHIALSREGTVSNPVPRYSKVLILGSKP